MNLLVGDIVDTRYRESLLIQQRGRREKFRGVVPFTRQQMGIVGLEGPWNLVTVLLYASN